MGLILAPSGQPATIQLGANLYWQNPSNDALRIELPAESVLADPAFADAANGDFTSKSAGKGLSNPAAILPVWDKWVAIRNMRQ